MAAAMNGKKSIEVIIHAAANTNVDGCELEPENCYRVNALGTRNVVVAADKVKAKLVYISTDYVFDGTAQRPYIEFDLPNPINVYGKYGNNFVKTIVRYNKERKHRDVPFASPNKKPPLKGGPLSFGTG